VTRRYTVTLTEDELALVETIVDRSLERKLVVERKPAASAAAPFVNTGNAELDDWMLRQYDRGVTPYKPKKPTFPVLPQIKVSGFKGRRHTLAEWNTEVVASWRRLGHEVVIEGGVMNDDGSNVRVLPLGQHS